MVSTFNNGIISPKNQSLREDILNRYFISRTDVFAHWNWELNRWQCTRKEIPGYLISSHLKGKITIATYPVNQLGNTPFTLFDIDNKSQAAYSLLGWLRSWFENDRILFLAENTGGRGLHGWSLFLCFVPAIKAIALANLALDAYKKEVGPLPCPVEIFPKQAKPKDVGNATPIALGEASIRQL